MRTDVKTQSVNGPMRIPGSDICFVHLPAEAEGICKTNAAAHSASPQESALYQVLYSQIESFGKLNQNWNGFQAKAPSEEAASIAKQVLNFCFKSDLLQSISVQVTGDESILFDINKGKLRLIVEIFSDGEITVLTSDERGDRCALADLATVSLRLAELSECDGANFPG